ncbi:MAG TPA: hypothetical protein VHX61_03475 [Rhizomicrobium sp.]|jgi:hypothetical protein|nr:hypothetical protein [Rhizomicrobium sp.]
MIRQRLTIKWIIGETSAALINFRKGRLIALVNREEFELGGRALYRWRVFFTFREFLFEYRDPGRWLRRDMDRVCWRLRFSGLVLEVTRQTDNLRLAMQDAWVVMPQSHLRFFGKEDIAQRRDSS